MQGPLGGMHMAMSFRRDSSVVDAELPPGTLRRILRFASPYRGMLWWFLLLIVIDAIIGAVNPLIFKAILDKGIGHGRVGLTEALAGVVALLAVIAAAVSLTSRWFSARIGEGLIYDMRSQVFEHIQRMPIAFFTRTQTGALISRINNDVLGAQQAFTGTLSNVVSNVISVLIVLGAMFYLSWQITLLALVLLPLFIVPARLMSGRLQRITRESYALNAEMSTQMSERFNVAGALLVKLFGRPADEDRLFRTKAKRVADIGVQQAMYARIFLVALSLVAALATPLV
jgi:ATP-binding cassette subfamily B protein